MTPLQMKLEQWREYNRISEAGEIARRAFANNSFDGVLTMIGVVMGNFVVGVQEATIVLVTGLSTALAIGISGGWGAYLTESAERSHAVGELEQFTLTELRDTKIGKDVTWDDIRKEFDAVYVAIGAHQGKNMGIPGEEGPGVWTGLSGWPAPV